MRTAIYGLFCFPVTTRVGEFLLLFVQFRTYPCAVCATTGAVRQRSKRRLSSQCEEQVAPP
jgi:hypothetical protein